VKGQGEKKGKLEIFELLKQEYAKKYCVNDFPEKKKDDAEFHCRPERSKKLNANAKNEGILQLDDRLTVTGRFERSL
jgi:hypothetical protein